MVSHLSVSAFFYFLQHLLEMSKDKRLTKKEMDERDTLAIMGDEDSVTGFLIAGLFLLCLARQRSSSLWRVNVLRHVASNNSVSCYYSTRDHFIYCTLAP